MTFMFSLRMEINHCNQFYPDFIVFLAIHTGE